MSGTAAPLPAEQNRVIDVFSLAIPSIRPAALAKPRNSLTIKLAVNAGVDMSMIPLDYTFFDYLVELVNEGEVPMSRIDEAVGRILKLKVELGLFETPTAEKESIANFGKEEYKEIDE